MKRKLLSFLLALACLAGGGCSFSFGQDKVLVSHTEEVKMATVELTTEDMVAIRALGVEADNTLLNLMAQLKSEGAIDFTLENGMVTSINGKENPADFSSCWMLYTSDTEMANNAWGEVEYQGKKLGSAVVGADFLPAVEGEVYVWYYQSF